MLQIPERLINFRCYLAGQSADEVGMTDVELPKLDLMTESISGAGIAGELESVVLGHFKALPVKLKWASVTKTGIGLLAPVVQAFDLRGSVQTQDPGLGVLATFPVRIECRGQIKSYNLGKFEPGKRMDSETEMECAVLRVSISGVPQIEIDKLNMRFIVNGIDYLRQVRVDMGGV